MSGGPSARAQRLSPARPARDAALLALQRSAGNRAVAGMLQRRLRYDMKVDSPKQFYAQQAMDQFRAAAGNLSGPAQDTLKFFDSSDTTHDLRFVFCNKIDEAPEHRGLTLPMASGVTLDPELKLAGGVAYVFEVKLSLDLVAEQDTYEVVKLVKTMQHELEFHVVPRARKLRVLPGEGGGAEDHANVDNVARAWATYLNTATATGNPSVRGRYFEDALQDLANSFTVLDRTHLQENWQRVLPLLPRTVELAKTILEGGGASRKMLDHLQVILSECEAALGFRSGLDFADLRRRTELTSWFAQPASATVS